MFCSNSENKAPRVLIFGVTQVKINHGFTMDSMVKPWFSWFYHGFHGKTKVFMGLPSNLPFNHG